MVSFGGAPHLTSCMRFMFGSPTQPRVHLDIDAGSSLWTSNAGDSLSMDRRASTRARTEPHRDPEPERHQIVAVSARCLSALSRSRRDIGHGDVRPRTIGAGGLWQVLSLVERRRGYHSGRTDAGQVQCDAEQSSHATPDAHASRCHHRAGDLGRPAHSAARPMTAVTHRAAEY